MKNKILKIIFAILLVKVIYKYKIICFSIKNSCEIFFNKIFPSMFLMFILSSLVIEFNMIHKICTLLKKITNKLFKINLNTSYVFFISILTGCPNNAKISKELYEKKYINKIDIQKILIFSHFINPFFILNTIKYKATLILFAHYIGNIILGIFTRNHFINMDNISEYNVINNKKFHTILFENINSAINTSLFILGTIITFGIFSTAFNIKFLNVVLELSNGINYLISANISLKLKTIFCGMLLSFGGLCIHIQVFGIISNLNIKYIPYFIYRIFHSIITGLIILILY